MRYAPEFELEVRLDGAIKVVAVRGEVDLYTAPRLAEALVETEGAPLLLDFSEVTFIDSTAVATLAAAHRRIAQEGNELTVLCEHPPVLATMNLSGLSQILQITSSHRLDGDGAHPAGNGDGSHRSPGSTLSA